MRYIKPHYYDDFRCVADQCPDTCCAGWQIVIDDESLEQYSNVRGPFGNRLYRSIDWEEGTFKQNAKRCSFLNDKNLCDLYSELGENALCRTCSMYPRHVEEFEGLRELSLSLSCPIAAEMILMCKEPLRLIEEETDEEEELADEFEDFDLLLFSQLEEARSIIFRILNDRATLIEERIQRVLSMAEQIQDCVEQERYCDVDDVIESFRRGEYYAREKSVWEGQREQNAAWGDVIYKQKMTDSNAGSRYTQMCREYAVLNRLERLREEWSWVLTDAWSVLYAQGEAAYMDICKRFDEEIGCKSPNAEKWSIFTENLMQFFVLTYFCGAVYDDWIYAKAALAAFCTRWIQELIMAKWADEELETKDCIQIAYRFAREIEHSDENLDSLEAYLQSDFSKRRFD